MLQARVRVPCAVTLSSEKMAAACAHQRQAACDRAQFMSEVSPLQLAFLGLGNARSPLARTKGGVIAIITPITMLSTSQTSKQEEGTHGQESRAFSGLVGKRRGQTGSVRLVRSSCTPPHQNFVCCKAKLNFEQAAAVGVSDTKPEGRERDKAVHARTLRFRRPNPSRVCMQKDRQRAAIEHAQHELCMTVHPCELYEHQGPVMLACSFALGRGK